MAAAGLGRKSSNSDELYRDPPSRVKKLEPPIPKLKHWTVPGERIFEWNGKGAPPLLRMPFRLDGRPVVPIKPSQEDALAMLDKRLARAASMQRKVAALRARDQEREESQQHLMKLTHTWTDATHGERWLVGLPSLPQEAARITMRALRRHRRRLRHTEAASLASKSPALAPRQPGQRGAGSAGLLGLSTPTGRTAWQRDSDAAGRVAAASSGRPAKAAGTARGRKHRARPAPHASPVRLGLAKRALAVTEASARRAAPYGPAVRRSTQVTRTDVPLFDVTIF